MIDLHCHLLPAIDDGPRDLVGSLELARALVADGVTHVACTPHILPGLYPNTGPHIRQATAQLEAALEKASIGLELLTGADNHLVPDFIDLLRSGRLLPIADSRYVLVEVPHQSPPPRLRQSFTCMISAGYLPILTHPERLAWIGSHYTTICELVDDGVWMQVTAGALTGDFGRRARYWGERMLAEGKVHILATDAHDLVRRPPVLGRARELAERQVGSAEATRLVLTRPQAILKDELPLEVVAPLSCVASSVGGISDVADNGADCAAHEGTGRVRSRERGAPVVRGFARRLRRFLD
jgi:protein-tyrosine phosphatase